MKLLTALELGRVSNLPTVWTNVLCALALTLTAFDWIVFAAASISMSLFYLAGMFMNDYFDFAWDSANNNPRPLVKGDTNKKEVLLFIAMFLVLAFAILPIASSKAMLPLALLSAACLLIFISLYDWKHKAWKISPWLMGACRLWVYLTVAALVSPWNDLIIIAGASLLFYIAGITYLAKAEQQNKITSYVPALLLFTPMIVAIAIAYDQLHTWLFVLANLVWLIKTIVATLPGHKVPIPIIIGQLLAGICLVDAMLISAVGHNIAALAALAGFGLCLLLQKRISAS